MRGLIGVVLGIFRRRAEVRIVGHLMAIRALSIAGNVCGGLLTAAYLGPDGRGELAALLIAPSVLTPFCTLGFHASVVYNFRSDPDHASKYFGSALILTCVASLIATTIGFGLLPHWLIKYDPATIHYAQILLVAVPLGAVGPIFTAVLEANGQFVRAGSMLYLQSLTTVAILVGLAVFGSLTPHSAAAAYIVLAFPSCFYLAWYATHAVRPRLTLAPTYVRRLVGYAVSFYGVDILGTLSGYLDQVLIVFLLEPAAVGAYAVALSLTRVLGIAQSAVSTVLFPSIAARDVGSVVATVARAVRVTTVANLAGAASLALLGPILLQLLYGTRFSGAIAPFLVLLLEAVVSSAARTLGQVFSGIGRPSAVTIFEVAGAVASIGGMLALVPVFGTVGAASGALLGGIIRMICVLALFRRIVGLALPRLVIARSDLTWIAGR